MVSWKFTTSVYVYGYPDWNHIKLFLISPCIYYLDWSHWTEVCESGHQAQMTSFRWSQYINLKITGFCTTDRSVCDDCDWSKWTEKILWVRPPSSIDCIGRLMVYLLYFFNAAFSLIISTWNNRICIVVRLYLMAIMQFGPIFML